MSTRGLTTIYLVLLALREPCTLVNDDRRWFTFLPAYLPLLLVLLPGLALGAFCLARRHRVLALLNWLPCLILPLLTAHFHAPSRGAAALQISSYNLAGRSIEIDRATDIACLQETATDTVGTDAKLPYVTRTRDHDLTILSRYPLEADEEFPLGSGAVALKATVRAAGGDLTVIDVHLMCTNVGPFLSRGLGYLEETSTLRLEQATSLQELIGKVKGPLVVAGDFNSPPTSAVGRMMRATLVDTFGEQGLGLGFSFPAGLPLWRIDYIYASRDLLIQDATTLWVKGSDHFSIRAGIGS